MRANVVVISDRPCVKKAGSMRAGVAVVGVRTTSTFWNNLFTRRVVAYPRTTWLASNSALEYPSLGKDKAICTSISVKMVTPWLWWMVYVAHAFFSSRTVARNWSSTAESAAAATNSSGKTPIRTDASGEFIAFQVDVGGVCTWLVGTSVWLPLSTSYATAASCTVAAMGPTLAMLGSVRASSGMRMNVALIPVTPLNAAGVRMEPHLSARARDPRSPTRQT
ncbi:hypothetical protein B5M09_001461 [Aphanomyces astaci]|uniref:Uncharacterized protein n=1 Tax=Aphanomyces astaci TaxID=112090 RepID=A0A3R7W683_APHAT|nr:hypothetical protein B5M09_001461 [Aphanomyces astaci]